MDKKSVPGIIIIVTAWIYQRNCCLSERKMDDQARQ